MDFREMVRNDLVGSSLVSRKLRAWQSELRAGGEASETAGRAFRDFWGAWLGYYGFINGTWYHKYKTSDTGLLLFEEFSEENPAVRAALDGLDDAARACPIHARLGGFELRLMPSVGDPGDIPAEGRSLVIIADVSSVLYFRVFEGDGRVVVDTNEPLLKEQAGPVADLKQRLEGLWPPGQPGEAGWYHLINSIASVVGYPRAGGWGVVPAEPPAAETWEWVDKFEAAVEALQAAAAGLRDVELPVRGGAEAPRLRQAGRGWELWFRGVLCLPVRRGDACNQLPILRLFEAARWSGPIRNPWGADLGKFQQTVRDLQKKVRRKPITFRRDNDLLFWEPRPGLFGPRDSATSADTVDSTRSPA